MIALFDQHGFYARVVSINNVLLHSTRGCGKKNGVIQDHQRRCFLSFERVAAGPEWAEWVEWVMLSQFWTRDHEKMKKQLIQADFVLTNLESKNNDWLCDLHEG